MNSKILVKQCLKEYIPNEVIHLILDYFKFHGIHNRSFHIPDTNKLDKLLILPNSKIITYTQTSKIKLWNSESGSCEKIYDLEQTSKIKFMELLLDGRILVGFFDCLVKIFDPVHWKFDFLERQCQNNKKLKLVKVISFNMIYIVISDYHEQVIFEKWNIETNTCESILLKMENIHNPLFFYDEERVIECLQNGNMNMYNIFSISDQHISFIGHRSTVKTIYPLPNNYLASGSRDSTIRIWDITTNICIKTLIGHKNRVFKLEMLPDYRLVSGSDDKTIKIWNLEKDDDIACEKTLENIYLFNTVKEVNGEIISHHLGSIIKFWI